MMPPRPTWITLDRAALFHNARLLRQRLAPGVKLMAVVKANAYGHDARLVAPVLVDAGADMLAVATLGEALDLRAAASSGAITAPILVLGYTPAHQAADAIAHAVTLTVFDLPTATAIAAAAQAVGTPARVHVKVNTGMNRLGVEVEDAPALLAALHNLPGLVVEGIFTHFATSDSDLDYARIQLDRFTALLTTLSGQGLRPPLAHAANSAALLTLRESHLDMARSGIALYGLDPDVDDCPLPADFRPALAWKAAVTQVRSLRPGDPVSYGREFVADRPMTVATLPVGYADGFPRRPHTWGHVLIHGAPAPILGRVCMDQCVVDVTATAARQPVRQGDEAVLIGRQGDAAITAAEAARRIGTINYDVVSRILTRVPRLWQDDTP